MTRMRDRQGSDEGREARLAEALRANLARRKTQVRARSGQQAAGAEPVAEPVAEPAAEPAAGGAAEAAAAGEDGAGRDKTGTEPGES